MRSTQLLTGVNLRWFEWEHFASSAPEELTLLYDNCSNCAASTYFTALHYDQAATHVGGALDTQRAGCPGVERDSAQRQRHYMDAGFCRNDGGEDSRAELCTWNHMDFGKQKRPSDTIFCYDVDPFSGLDRTQEVTGHDVDPMKLRLCRGQDTVQGLERGQDSALCQQLQNAQPQRKPVTTPPANNLGRSAPPGGRH